MSNNNRKNTGELTYSLGDKLAKAAANKTGRVIDGINNASRAIEGERREFEDPSNPGQYLNLDSGEQVEKKEEMIKKIEEEFHLGKIWFSPKKPKERFKVIKYFPRKGKLVIDFLDERNKRIRNPEEMSIEDVRNIISEGEYHLYDYKKAAEIRKKKLEKEFEDFIVFRNKEIEKMREEVKAIIEKGILNTEELKDLTDKFNYLGDDIDAQSQVIEENGNSLSFLKELKRDFSEIKKRYEEIISPFRAKIELKKEEVAKINDEEPLVPAEIEAKYHLKKSWISPFNKKNPEFKVISYNDKDGRLFILIEGKKKEMTQEELDRFIQEGNYEIFDSSKAEKIRREKFLSRYGKVIWENNEGRSFRVEDYLSASDRKRDKVVVVWDDKTISEFSLKEFEEIIKDFKSKEKKAKRSKLSAEKIPQENVEVVKGEATSEQWRKEKMKILVQSYAKDTLEYLKALEDLEKRKYSAGERREEATKFIKEILNIRKSSETEKKEILEKVLSELKF